MKKGFTLIELLAVIVILAIIALIATPIVLNIINESKDNATLSSADFYLDAVEMAVANSTLKEQKISDGTYQIKDGDVCLDNGCIEKVVVQVKGEKPAEGTITIVAGKIESMTLVLNDKIIRENNEGKLVITDPTPSECFTYIDNYEYIINKEVCMSTFGEMADEAFETGAGELICSGDKRYGDLIELASISDISKEELEQAGVISNIKENETITITGYTCGGENGPHKDVVIPKEIEGKKVVSIRFFSFSGIDMNGNPKENATINSIIIPNSVTAIGSYAFAYNQLTSVIIPDSVTTIGESAFAYNQLTSIIIPNSVTTIEDWTFGYNQLTSVTIPNSVTTILEYVFSNNQLMNITIPNSVTLIGSYAFDENPIEEVKIDNVSENVTLYNSTVFGEFDVNKIQWLRS